MSTQARCENNRFIGILCIGDLGLLASLSLYAGLLYVSVPMPASKCAAGRDV